MTHLLHLSVIIRRVFLPDACRFYTAHVEFGPNDHRQYAPHFIQAFIKQRIFQATKAGFKYR